VTFFTDAGIASGPAFLAAGFLALVALGLWWRARRFVARLVRASGRISHFAIQESKRWKGEGQGSDTDVTYFPHVEFHLPTGERVAFQSRSSRSNQATQGSTVSVVYDPAAPASSAEIEGRPAWFKAWSPVLTAAALSVLVLLFALYVRFL
jgi:hypothetical protein